MEDEPIVSPDDTEFEESTIAEVDDEGSGYGIRRTDGWSLWVGKIEGLPTPMAGDVIRCYGGGIGFTVRGVVIGGHVYRYKTAEQDRADHERSVADAQAKREAEFNEKHKETDARIAALPSVFRQRMEKFQRDGGHEFRRDYEGYELFCCEQAVVIAEALKTLDAINVWREMPWEQQKATVDGLSGEHSGNTFGAASMLACFYIDSPEYVAKAHGALTPLVGCDAYGCKHEAQ